MTPRKILFVCSGNQCRSPMAARLFEKLLQREGMNGIEALSAGTVAAGGEKATEDARLVCEQLGIDLSGHCAVPVTTELLRQCDLILVMERNHHAIIAAMCPDLEQKARLLRTYVPHEHAGEEILDPTGMSLMAHRSCLAQIMESLEGLIKALKDGGL